MVKDIRSLNAGVSGNAPDEPLNWSIASDTNILPSYGLMKTIERIKMMISEMAKSERDFSIKIGVNQVTLNNYTANKRKLSLEIIEAILNAFPEISAEWLLSWYRFHDVKRD